MLGPEEFIKDAIQKIKEQIGDEKAIIALSGGVDSSVCSVLVQEAIGDNLIAIFTKWVGRERIYYNEFTVYAKTYVPSGSFEDSDFVE